MGLPPEDSEDHLIRDETTATWTRVIVVHMRALYVPDEGGETRGDFAPQAPHPRVSSLRGARLTTRRDGKTIRDNWRTASKEALGADGVEDLLDWEMGVFRQVIEASEVQEVGQVAVETVSNAGGALGDLVFQEERDFSPQDDLIRKPLDPELVARA